MPKTEERNLKKEAKKHGTMAKQHRLPRRKKKQGKSR
jgi:hypothetical protein